MKRCAIVALTLAALAAWAAVPTALAANPKVVPPAAVTLGEPTLPEGTAIDEDRQVVMILTIEADGSVSAADVDRGTGEPFDSAAAAAALLFRFSPATADGVPVRVRVPFTYTFYKKQVRRGLSVSVSNERRDIEPAPGFVFAGTVIERGSRTPQAGVPVRVVDARTKQSYEVITDDKGRFTLFGLPTGELDLDVFTGDFKELRRKVRVAARTEAEARATDDVFYLEPGGLSAYRTVVKEKRPPRAASVIDLTEDEVRRVPGTFGDPTRVVATLPGVARSPFGLGYYVVRGAEFDNTGFFIDGHPAIYLYHLLGGPGVINPELVGGLSFYPGGYPARYGRYAAGVIAVETKEPPRDRWHLDADFNLFQAGVLFSVPFDDKKGEVTLSFRRSYYELLLPLFTDDATLSFTDYLARVSYDFAPGLRGRFIAIGAIDTLSTRNISTADGDGESSTTLGLGFHRLNLALDADLSRDVTWTNSVAWEWEYTNNRRVAQGDQDLGADIGGWFLSARSFVTARALKELSIEAGLDFLYLDFSADLRVPVAAALGDPRPPAFDPVIVPFSLGVPTMSLAPYVSADIEVVPGLRLLPGLRLSLDDYGSSLHATVDPKIAVRYAVSDEWTLKGMAALAHQAPNVFQVSPPFGDPSLPLVQATQGSLGFEWKPASDWLLSVEGFVQLLDQLPEPANALVDDNGDVGRVYWDAKLRGRSFGAEVLIRKDFGGVVYGWLSYTLSRAERYRGPDRGWNLFELDQTHILNLAWTVRLGREWSLGARFQLASGNPFYPIDGARYDADSDRFIPTYAATQSRLEFYHRLDVRLDKRWRFDDWMFEFYLDIQNVYNQQNSESPQYSFDYKVKQDGPALPFLPTLGVRAVF